tara:strand:+ start:252 stop:668 length:417 start_codon:yes stop_codon:yes gene_type:complete
MLQDKCVVSVILSLDIGERRIGVARCDPLGILVTPLEIMVRNHKEADLGSMLDLIEREDPSLIVIGLPLTLTGEEGHQALKVRDDVRFLLSGCKTKIVFWDERFTTAEAERRFGTYRDNDSIAAAILLEDYLASRGDI